MYHEYTFEQLRTYCRNCIESVEVWARRLIHEKMTAKYGDDYIHCTIDNVPIIKKEIVRHVEEKQGKEPDRFKRAVDTLFIEHIVYFLYKQAFYKELFKEALDYAYPQGREEARHYLSKLVEIRHPLSHSNPITIRQVEQAICYSHDFIDGLKEYYKDRGEEKVWNVPQIIRIRDSLGNVFVPEDSNFSSRVEDTRIELVCGESYSLEVEIDSSFSNDEYTIRWKCFGKKDSFDNQHHISLIVEESDVALNAYIECVVVSNKKWHKYKHHDDRVILVYSILPPSDN